MLTKNRTLLEVKSSSKRDHIFTSLQVNTDSCFT